MSPARSGRWRSSGALGVISTMARVVAFACGTWTSGSHAEAQTANAATIFRGWMTDNQWNEIATLDDVRFRDSWLLGVGVSRELAGRDNWAFELEGQTVRHHGEQEHWEFNAALFARWRGLPWSDVLPTSVASGVGPSYATKEPAAEIAMDGESARLLLYWTAEMEVSFPETPWSAITRLHHRSNV